MKNLKRIFIHSIIYGSFLLCFTSCELFDLELQSNYDNKSAPAQEELGVSCFEFVKSRSNQDMALFYEAILWADMQDIYETDGLTFFLVKDDVFSGWLASLKYASVKSVAKTVMRNYLLGYIVKGTFHTSELTITPINVPTLDGTKIISMRLYPPAANAWDQNQLQAGYNTNGTINYRYAWTTNLKPTNGIIHVLKTRL